MIIEKLKKHGTTYSYNKGCRCKKCCNAKRDYRKKSSIKGHGTKWYYDKGCRCEECKKAKSEYWHKQNPDAKPRTTTNVEDNTRLCHVCKKRKSLEDYGRCKGRFLDKMYECKDCHNERSKKNKNTPGQRFSTYRSGAKVRKIKFDISFKQFMKFWCKPCYYCGTDIDGIGLDRKDSNDGYNIGNIVSCCSRCNRSKTIQTADDFISMCLKVADKFQNRIVGPTRNSD